MNADSGLPQLYSWAAPDLDNPLTLLAVSINVGGGCGLSRCPPYYFSFDGGLSWPTQAVSLPLIPPGYSFASDPTCSFDRHSSPGNNAYACHLLVNEEFELSATPESIVTVQRSEAGQLGAFGTITTVFAAPSQAAVPPPSPAPESRYGVDKPFLHVDQGPTSAGRNGVYVAAIYWVPDWPDTPRVPGNYVFLNPGVSSPPGNAAWTTSFIPANLPLSPGGIQVCDEFPHSGSKPEPEYIKHDAPYVATASTGWVYVCWIDYPIGTAPGAGATHWMDRSAAQPFGTAWGADQLVHTLAGSLIRRAPPGTLNATWVNSHPKIAVNPFNPNEVYVVWSEIVLPEEDSNIYFKPVTWSPPPAHVATPGPVVQVNNPALDGDAWDFHPTIAVDFMGRIHVIWYSERHSQGITELNVYHAVSVDGGMTFGDVVSTFDRRVNVCPTDIRGPLLPWRYNYDPADPWPGAVEPHLGNYIGSPAALFPSPLFEPPYNEIRLTPVWIFSHPPAVPPRPASPDTEVVTTPLHTNSLAIVSPASHVLSLTPPPAVVTFDLGAGVANAGRPFWLLASMTTPDRGAVLPPGPGTCPPVLYAAPPPGPGNPREVVFPLDLGLPYWVIATGSLGGAGYARVNYTVPQQSSSLGSWWFAFYLYDSGQGLNFASNATDLTVTP